MNFHLFSLAPSDRKQKTHRESTGSSLMPKTVAVVVNDENNDIPPPPPLKKPRRGSDSMLETIEENVLEESGAGGAPRVTIRKTAPRNYAVEEREPIENIIPVRKHHRRSMALSGDDFEGITMRCDELHGQMGPPRVRRPAIYNAGRWELQDGNKLRSCF